MLSNTNYSDTQTVEIPFAPQIIVQAGDSTGDLQSTVKKGVRDSFAEFELFFEKLMERYNKKQKRIRQGV